MTFSIVGFDPRTGDLGIAVASKFLAVGAVVPWAEAGVGAVATQAAANTSYGPRGLELLRSGLDPSQAVAQLQAEDDAPGEVPMRQVGIVDASGRAASVSGAQCMDWAGGRSGSGYACQVVRSRAGYGGRNDRYIDLRVDDHRQPIDELRRILRLWRVYFETPNPRDLIALTPELATEVQSLLQRAGVYAAQPNGAWDQSSARALRTWAGVENLEERLREGGIDPLVLRLLREQHAR